MMHSEQISTFLNFLQNARNEYTYCYEQVGKADKQTVDLLHDLELADLRYSERAKLATELRQVRQERRRAKDTVEVTGKIIAVIDQPHISKAMEALKQMIGEVRKVEQYHAKRTYHRRHQG